MSKIEYSLSYLPLFYDDLESLVMYISDVLCNKTAANELLNAVEAAILDRLPNAEAFEPYHSKKERKKDLTGEYMKRTISIESADLFAYNLIHLMRSDLKTVM